MVNRYTVTTEATVTYVCYLNEEQSKLVDDYAEANDCDLEISVMSILYDCELNLYKESNDVDCHTNSITSVELTED